MMMNLILFSRISFLLFFLFFLLFFMFFLENPISNYYDFFFIIAFFSVDVLTLIIVECIKSLQFARRKIEVDESVTRKRRQDSRKKREREDQQTREEWEQISFSK